MFKRFFIQSFILIAAVASINAQSLSVGPQFGFIKSTDADDAIVMPGAALRLNLVGFSVEGSVYYKSEEYNNGLIKAKSYPIMLTAMINILPILHAEGGIGWYNTKIEYSGNLSTLKTEKASDVGYHLGAGVELPAGNILLTGDIRYVFLNVELNNFANVSELKSNFYVIMVGVMFKF